MSEIGNKRILFVSHGGGPLPLLGHEEHKEMISTLKSISKKIRKPSAILMISAHWEEKTFHVTSTDNPSLIYDYYGFPRESYSIEYPCKSDPTLAEEVIGSFKKAGIECNADEKRGFDHGLFVPLKIMYPEAHIPCIQLSLKSNMNAEEHINIGTALSNIDYDNLLIIGSGFSFHNMSAFFSEGTHISKEKNESFEDWLINTFSDSTMSEDERTNKLIHWDSAPSARFCHPREEHLLPLHVCYGASGKTACMEYFEVEILNKKSSMYLW
eukprot:TRINITY_DN270916_c0_g1_i1.p1 TRINITY_DN270916_c0_g1~~TRINITY_DN270916_c0_g1_i1.p1  ORF type:complete len:269 (-),score=54.24 TRINITY_DN270916_c0_g1_i1:103-909(-)